jgi:type 1 glutamine amidotransferase
MKMSIKFRIFLFGLGLAVPTVGQGQPEREFTVSVEDGDLAPRPRRVFYMGRAEASFHNPQTFYSALRRPFAERGLRFTFFNQLGDLNATTLADYDSLFIYGDVQTSTSSSEVFGRPYVDAIVDFVEQGGGLTGMHVASACFRNSTDFGNLLGGRFLGHFAYQSFSPNVPDLEFHPITSGLGTYTSFDEPYQIKNLNPDVMLLGTRDGIGNEPDDRPYTWVRTQGLGKVFYHANGHDSSSWNEPNFRELIIRGTQWASREGNGGMVEGIEGVTLSQLGKMSYVAGDDDGGVLQQAVYSESAGANVRATTSGHSLFDNEAAGIIETGPWTSAAISGSGSIALSTQIVRAGATGDLAALLVGNRQCPNLVAASGLVCVQAGSGMTYSGVTHFEFEVSEAEEVLFRAQLENPALPENNFILSKSNGQATSRFLMEGDLLADGITVIRDLESGDFSISDSGFACVQCTISSGGPDKNAILSDRSGNLVVEIEAGAGDPGLPPGTVIEEIKWSDFRNNGEIVFVATLTGDFVTPANDTVVCLLPSVGSISVILREGNSVGGKVVQDLEAGWEATASEAHFATIVSTDPSGHAVLVASNTGASRVGADGDILDEGLKQWRVRYLPNENPSCAGGEIVMKVGLEDVSDPAVTEKALVLMGRLQTRILMRTGWSIATGGGALIIDQLDFVANQHGRSGHLESGELAFVAKGVDGSHHLLKMDLSDSLDGDTFHDDLEIAFGGNPDVKSVLPPPGMPRFSWKPDGTPEMVYWENNSFAGGYNVYESSDLINWTRLENLPAFDIDQIDVPIGYQRYRHEVESPALRNFFRIELNYSNQQ